MLQNVFAQDGMMKCTTIVLFLLRTERTSNLLHTSLCAPMFASP